MLGLSMAESRLSAENERYLLRTVRINSIDGKEISDDKTGVTQKPYLVFIGARTE